MTLSEHLTDQLRAMIADLDGYIERRASEIAEPRINDVKRAAQVEVDGVKRQAAFDKQRAEDLEIELRRQIAALRRQVERANQQVGGCK